MESEKVKEIKKALECQSTLSLPKCEKCNYKFGIVCKTEKLLEDALTLINELESENERLKKALVDNLEAYKDGFNEGAGLKKRVDDKLKTENQQLKDLIAELEQECAKNAHCVKEFAERLKGTLEEYRLENEYFTKDEPNGNLWQMNSSVFYIEVTQDGGLIDEILKEFIKD